MSKIVFNGGILGNKKVYGVQRYSLEILSEFDKLIDKNYAEVLVPSDCCLHENFFKNIAIVKSNKKRKTKVQKLIWDQFVFRKKNKKNKLLCVDTLVALPVKGCDISTIYDCRTILFPNNKIINTNGKPNKAEVILFKSILLSFLF